MTATRLLLLGPPGVGKGTQAQKLIDRLGIPQISTGEMLRAAVAADSSVGRHAKGYMERGELVPDDVVIGVARERLSQRDAGKGFVLDGFPRTVQQAQALDRILSELGVELERCVVLTAEPGELVKRLLRRAELEGRPDDNEETIGTRMRVYEQETAPLVAYYREHGIVAHVDGLGEIEAIADRIAEALEDR